MSKGIKISSKYGLNPSIPTCAFCGQPKNELVLFGKMGRRNEDIEAPKNPIIDYEPCDKCKEMIGDNVLVIGVEDKGTKNIMPIQNNLIPTGTWCVMPVESVVRIFQLNEDMKEKVSKAKRLLIENTILESILAQHAQIVKEAGDNDGEK